MDVRAKYKRLAADYQEAAADYHEMMRRDMKRGHFDRAIHWQRRSAIYSATARMFLAIVMAKHP